jgi:hypothetical protein
MSQISVLGFQPSSQSSSSSIASGNTHWAILISPHPPSPKAPKPKSRFFHAKISTKEPVSDSALFDMHKHQLRQQPFPIPLKEGPSSSTDTSQSETASSPEPTPEVVSITTLNADSAHPLQLILRITASILPQTPQRLIPKLSHRLYNTPTYGPEDDWLRDALSAMHDGLLEPGFDVDKFVEYASSAVKDYAMYEASSEDEDEDHHQQQQTRQAASKENPVLTLDYASHIARNAQVKAMLNQQSPQQQQQNQSLLTPPQSPKIPHVNQQLPQQQQKKPRTWLGFRISASPGTGGRRAPERHSFERQDDPYGGLM